MQQIGFRSWCTVENKWVESWNPAAPQVCPNNPAHAVNVSRTSIIASRNIDTGPFVKFSEDFNNEGSLNKWEVSTIGVNSKAEIIKNTLGVCRMTAGDTNGDYVTISNSTLLLNVSDTLYMQSRIRTNDISGMYFTIGFYHDVDNYILFIYDNGIWYAENASNGSKTKSNITSSMPIDFEWHKFEIDESITGNISFYIDDTFVVNHITNIPSVSLECCTKLQTLENASKNIEIDLILVNTYREVNI